MTPQGLYERDLYGWTQETARLLREGRFEKLDIKNLVEEVEDLGRRERRELCHRFTAVMEHLLYIAYLTRDPARDGHGWRPSVKEARRRARDLLKDNPSLKHELDQLIAKAYSYATLRLERKSELMHREGKISGAISEEELPSRCPWTARELFEEERYFTRAEIERQAQQMERPPSYSM